MNDEQEGDLQQRVADLEQEVARLREMVVFLVKEHWKAIGYNRSEAEEEELNRIEAQRRALKETKGNA